MDKTDKYVSLQLGKSRISISLMCIAAFIYFARYSIFSFAKCFHISTGLLGGATLIMFAASLVCYTIMSRRICWDGVLVVLGAMAFFGITLILHPDYQYRYEDPFFEGRFGVRSVFAYGAGIYSFYLIRLFSREKEKLYKLFQVIAYSIVCLEIWTVFLNRSEEYMMTFGYQMEMAAILFLASYLENKKRGWHLWISATCMLAGVLYGPRACILGYAFFFAVYICWKGKMDRKQTALIILIMIAAICYSSQMIMVFIYRFFSSLGLHSRTLYLIAMGDIMAADTARQDHIYPVLFDALKRMPIWGMYGAYGDRVLLDPQWAYAHNFVFEIVLQFGYILGGGFIIWMMIEFVKVIRYNKDSNGLLTIIFGCFTLCKLFFSNTFWQEPYFWAFIAMLLNCQESRKQQKKLGAIYVLRKKLVKE